MQKRIHGSTRDSTEHPLLIESGMHFTSSTKEVQLHSVFKLTVSHVVNDLLQHNPHSVFQREDTPISFTDTKQQQQEALDQRSVIDADSLRPARSSPSPRIQHDRTEQRQPLLRELRTLEEVQVHSVERKGEGNHSLVLGVVKARQPAGEQVEQRGARKLVSSIGQHQGRGRAVSGV